jgi:hypothetical protein
MKTTHTKVTPAYGDPMFIWLQENSCDRCSNANDRQLNVAGLTHVHMPEINANIPHVNDCESIPCKVITTWEISSLQNNEPSDPSAVPL